MYQTIFLVIFDPCVLQMSKKNIFFNCCFCVCPFQKGVQFAWAKSAQEMNFLIILHLYVNVVDMWSDPEKDQMLHNVSTLRKPQSIRDSLPIDIAMMCIWSENH